MARTRQRRHDSHALPVLLPVVAAAAMFTAAGGLIHLLEWLEVYRHVPSATPGAFVVRVGFPVNAVISAVLAGALLYVGWRRSRFTLSVLAAAAVFQAGSLFALIATRTGSLSGWAEPQWTMAAKQTLTAEVAALLSLTAAFVITMVQSKPLRHRGDGVVTRPPAPCGTSRRVPVPQDHRFIQAINADRNGRGS